MVRPLGFPAARRLASPLAFDAVFKRGQRVRDNLFSVFFLPNRKPYPRLGMVVGRRVAARAVVRNRIKRAIRESARAHQALLGGLDVVVLAYPTAARDPRACVEALATLWGKVRQQCGTS